MKRLVALIGVRGAGKSTILSSLNNSSMIQVLKPTTDRPKRGPDDEEYEFVTDFPHGNAMAWKIKVGGHSYGVRATLLKEIPEGVCGITVFYPGSIDVLEDFRRKWSGEVITIGLDTITSLEQQHSRVAGGRLA